MRYFIEIILLLLLSTNVVACVKEDPTLPPVVEEPTTQPEQPNRPQNTIMKVIIGDATFTVTLAANATAEEFKSLLPVTLNMSDFNRNEKVCSLPRALTTAASNPGTIHAGDLMLFGSSSLVLFYDTFATSYSYTRIGKIDNTTGLIAALGSGSVTVRFELQ